MKPFGRYEMPDKECARCEKTKDKAEFNKHRDRPDGLQRECRTCSNANCKTYRKNNEEKVSKYNKKYREENLEKCKAYNKVDPKVKQENILARRRKFYGEAKEFAESKEGELLSTEDQYINAHCKLLFNCKYKHEFTRSYNSALKSWCPICSDFSNEIFCKMQIEHNREKVP
jgi:hypothetical protein